MDMTFLCTFTFEGMHANLGSKKQLNMFMKTTQVLKLNTKSKNMNLFHAHVPLLRFVLSEDVEQTMTGS